ncbi:MAG: nitrate- and nitrite sensing domain-containing protein [Catenulispora sp.]
MARRPHGSRPRARRRPHTFRARMVRIMAVSLATALVPLGFLVAADVGAYRAADSTVRTVTAVQDIQALIHELQKERGLTVGLLGGDGRFRAQLAGQRALTDAAEATLDGQVNHGLLGAVEVRSAMAKLAILDDTRISVDRGDIERAGALGYYTDAIAALNTLDFGADSTTDPVLRRGLLALESLGDAKEFTGRERALLSGVFAARGIQQTDYFLLVNDLAGKKAALDRFARTATPAEQAALAAAEASAAARQARADQAVAVDSAGRTLTGQVDPVSWFGTMTTYINSLRQVQLGIGADIDARAAALRAAAREHLIVMGLLALAAVAFELCLAIGALRSVVGPLALLSLDAQELAVRRLPEAVERLRTAYRDGADSGIAASVMPVTVPARSGAEIVALADALRLAQGSALALAIGQAALRRNTADSILNLARRHQNLVRRQIAVVTALEQGEADEECLERLFEVDHLATRMRRNAESLLVLVGEAAPRRWAEPLSVLDLMRAAMSEVEDYPRVALRRVDEALVAGAVVPEVAHLLAELLENGLQFSPPGREVEICGQAGSAGYLISVTDHGIGMTPEALAAANAKLRGREQFDVAPTRFLGHYVVGRLAERLGARVGLTAAPTGGIVARIELPDAVLVDARAAAPDAPRAESPVPAPDHAAEAARVLAEQRARSRARSSSTVVRTGSGLPTRMPHGSDRTARPESARPPEQAAVLLAAFASFSSGHQRGTVAAGKSPHPSRPAPKEEQ